MTKRACIVFLAVGAMPLCLSWADAAGRTANVGLPVDGRQAGGPCEYAEYRGTATITSVGQTERSREQATNVGGAGYEGYEVWFRFSPEAELREEWARPAAEREHPFCLMNSWYPGPRYIEKYGIKKGRSYRCTLRVITRGTCTPTIFDFPEIRRDDYFESAR
jgi:hypothetical protein